MGEGVRSEEFVCVWEMEGGRARRIWALAKMTFRGFLYLFVCWLCGKQIPFYSISADDLNLSLDGI